jgi:hypothetical protein
MAVTIVGAPGAHVAITATSGDAIDVEAGSDDTVVLRNLYLNGIGGSADTGINYTSGQALQLENVTVSGFSSAGVSDTDPNGQLYASGLDAHNDGVYGVFLNPASGTAAVDLDNVRVEDNADYGIVTGGPSVQLRLSDCIVSGNHYGVSTDGPAMVSGCQLSDNIFAGLVADTDTVQIGGSTVTHNGYGLFIFAGTVQSFGDNLVAANTHDTSGTITAIGKT